LSVEGFGPLTIPYFEDMKYSMDPVSQLPHFTLSKSIPQAVGSLVEIPICKLLNHHGLSRLTSKNGGFTVVVGP